jgi:TolB-like protein/Tfp pilus assembly protein PilF
MLIEFQSAIDAVEAAIAMQARIGRSEAQVDPDRRIRMRMGVHLADVIADDLDLYGEGVNLAARLRDLGGPEEIIISTAVRDQLADGLGVTIEDLGDRNLKGIERPVRAFRALPPGPPPVRGRLRHAGARPAIAVLPFRNLSGDPAHDFLGDLFAEDLIGDLSRHTDLFVISRLSTRPFRDRLYELRNVADVLGVRYVLSGNLQTSGGRLRMMAELTEAEAAHVIWAENFDGSLADVFDLQDRLSKEITSRALPFLRQLELQRARSKRSEDLTAYEWTLRAIDHFHRSSHEDMDQARAMFEAAIKVDQSYVTPYAWLAHWYVRRVGQGWSENRERDTGEATRYADKAVEIDSTDPLALTVSGLVSAYLKKDLDLAMTRYDRALAINPSASSAWVWSTSACSWLGEGDEAVRRSQRAIELSPFDPLMYTFTSIAGTAHAVAGQYDKAIEFCRRSLRQNRMFASTHRTLAISLALAGRIDEARAAGAELLKLEPTLTISGFKARYPGSASPQGGLFAKALAQSGVPN